MSIILGADIVPTKSNFTAFENADVDSLLDEPLKTLLGSVGYRIFNLEVPLYDGSSPIDKGGHNMIAPTKTARGIKALGADLLTLSNNHILDHGAPGLASTMNSLDEQGIAHVGAGENLADASKAFFFQHNGRTIGVYACAEHEYSIAGKNKAGANPFNPLESLDHISALKDECDYVIVLYHGGKEHYRYPSPHLQEVCRKIVDKGADLVVCQHSHCIGCEEKYKNSTILYGQGNFLFDLCDNEYWCTSILLKLNDDFSIEYIPIMRDGAAVRMASPQEAEDIMDKFHERSRAISVDGFVEKNYREFAKRATGYYFLEFKDSPIRMFLFRAFNKLSGQKLMENYSYANSYKGRHWKALRNYIECEAHRELILSALDDCDE